MKKKYFFTVLSVLAICFIKADAQTYNINSVAGNNIDGYFGDGGAATDAGFMSTDGVAIDASGNIYIADGGNNRIRKVNTSGIITTIAGDSTQGYSGDGGPATAAELNYPAGVAVDASGNVYIADYNNSRIRKVNTSGIITTIAGKDTAGYSGDGGAATAAKLNYPNGVAIDASGNVYIVDRNNGRIRKVNTSGIITTIAGDSTQGYSGDGGAATAAELYYPAGVAFDATGNIYIADEYSNRIRKVNTSGIIATIAGNGIHGYSGDESAATVAELNQPTGVAVDASGNLYIADHNNNRIRKVNTSGIITTIAGDSTQGYSGDGGAATAAELYYPWAVCVNTSGNIYIADLGNNHIRELTVSTGIATLTANSEISLYPNPANTVLNLSFTMQGLQTNATINVLDITGKIILKTESEISNGKTLPINISKLSAGFYFVKITTEKNTQTIKFVKTDN